MQVDRLEILIQAEANKANAELDKLISKLTKVSSVLTATNTNGLKNLSSGIRQLSSSMQTMSGVKTTDFNRLTKGIEKLGSINNSNLYKSSNSIRNFSNSLQGIGSVSDDAVKLGEISNSISKFGSASMQKATTTLPQLSSALKEFMRDLSTSPKVSENIIRMTNAMAGLAQQGSKYGSAIKSISSATNTLTKSNNSATQSHKQLGNSMASLTAQAGKLLMAYYSLKRAVEFIGGSIKKSMDFTETVNLFQTSFKKIGMEDAVKNGMEWGSKSADAYAKNFIAEAQTFNDKITEALSLDPNMMLKYQATFAQISSAMGLTAKTASNVSQSMTLLGNDIASLWNINTSTAMTKLQAGLTGQVRPLRELGIDITQASLQNTAYKYGVNELVANMSQAEKVQLRWLTIMKQSSVAFGDMAKTINSPANQIRILKQQWDNLSRSIGNVFLPIVSTVLPYINAFVIAIRRMVDSLATAMGYELPDYTNSSIYTDLTGDLDGMGDAAEGAAEANQKLKKSMAGFDQLNILSKNSVATTTPGTGGTGNPALDDAIREKTDSYMKKFNEQLAEMSNKSKELADGISEFFSKVADKAAPSTTALANLWNNGLSKFVGFIGTGITDWYKDFLAPVGTWVLGKGLPDLLNILNDFLMNIDFDKLNKGWDDLYKALAPFTIALGTGLIAFIGGLASFVTPAFNLAIGVFSTVLSGIASVINLIPSEVVSALGGAIGGFVVAILGFNSIAKALDMIADFKIAMGALMTVIQANPVLLIAGAIGALVGAFLTLDKVKFDSSAIGKYDKKIDELVLSSQNLNKEIDDLLKKQNDRNQDIKDEYGGIQILADKYFNLADKQSKTNAEQKLLKSYASDLVKKIPELNKQIDLQTGAYKGTKDEIQKTINKTKEYYLVQAAQESLTEITKEQYKAQQDLANAEASRRETVEKLATAQNSLNRELQDSVKFGDSQATSAKKAFDIHQKYDGIIYTLKEDLSKTNAEILETTNRQADLNKQWDYATDYITKYSDTTKEEFKTLPSSVQAALDAAKKSLSGYKPPKPKWGIGDEFTKLPSSVQAALEAAKKSVKKIKLPKIKLEIEFNEVIKEWNTSGGKHVKIHISPSGYAYPEVYAKGGFPTTGQLFVANEAGPELVGNMGGRTAVANRDQIQVGIASAVEEVMMKVLVPVLSNMNKGSGNIEVPLYLDGEELARGIYKGEQSRQNRMRPVKVN